MQTHNYHISPSKDKSFGGLYCSHQCVEKTFLPCFFTYQKELRESQHGKRAQLKGLEGMFCSSANSSKLCCLS